MKIIKLLISTWISKLLFKVLRLKFNDRQKYHKICSSAPPNDILLNNFHKFSLQHPNIHSIVMSSDIHAEIHTKRSIKMNFIAQKLSFAWWHNSFIAGSNFLKVDISFPSRLHLLNVYFDDYYNGIWYQCLRHEVNFTAC